MEKFCPLNLTPEELIEYTVNGQASAINTVVRWCQTLD